MAYQGKGILGGFRGTVGDVVGTSSKGKDVVKSRELSRIKSMSTAAVGARLAQKNATWFTVCLLDPIIKFAGVTYQGDLPKYQLFLKQNKSKFLNNGTIDWLNISMGSGEIGTGSMLVRNSKAGGLLEAWPSGVLPSGAANSDVFSWVVFNQTLLDFRVGKQRLRNATRTTIPMPSNWLKGHYICYYYIFVSSNGLKRTGLTKVNTFIVS